MPELIDTAPQGTATSPESFEALTPSEKVARILQIYQSLSTTWAEFRAAALRNYRYVIGDQIDKDIREQLRLEHRPEVVFNKLQSKVVALAGTIENNHAYLRAVPVREGDEKLADMHTVIVSDYAMKNCHGYKEIAKAAIDAAIAKIGWTNNYPSFRKDPEGEWITESFDPFMIMFDPMSRKQDLSDCKYYVVSAFYTAEEILQIYGDSLTPEMKKRIKEEDERITQVKPGPKPKSWLQKLTGGVTDLFNLKHDEELEAQKGSVSQLIDARNGIYRVIEFHDRRISETKVVYDPVTRQSKALRQPEEGENSDTYEAYVQSSTGAGIALDIPKEELWVTACAPGLLPDVVLLEKAYPVQGAGWQHKPIFCYDFHPDVTKTQAIIDVLIQPSDSYNQRQMTMLEMIMDAVHPSWNVKKGSIDELDLPDWKGKVRGILRWWHGNPTDKPEQQTPPAGAFEMAKVLSQEHAELADELSGITPNVQGTAETKGESGRLYNSRVRQGMVMMAYYMGNISFSMTQIFNYCDKSLKRFMRMPRAIRLLDKTNTPHWLELNMQTINGVVNDVTQGEFDFVVDTSQLGETAKQMQLAVTTDALQVIPPEYVLWPKYIKMLDIPDADEMAAFAQQIMDMKLGALQQKMAMQQQSDRLKLAGQTAQTVGQLNAAGEPPQDQQAQEVSQ